MTLASEAATHVKNETLGIEASFGTWVVERGPMLRERARALARFHQTRIPDPERNLLFGEGGAGTYSDGKLYAAAGFKPINRTRYTLQYTDKSKVYPREKFQKYKLKDWPGYSEEKTANEIVMENGILPIYAAGVTTWEIDLSTKMR